MADKQKGVAKKPQRPAHAVRRGAIAASIWLRQTQTGMDYFDFSLSRSWKSRNTNKEGYSTSFFPRNAPEIVEVVHEATAWIRAQEDVSAETAESPVESNEPSRVPLGRITPVKVPVSEAKP